MISRLAGIVVFLGLVFSGFSASMPARAGDTSSDLAPPSPVTAETATRELSIDEPTTSDAVDAAPTPAPRTVHLTLSPGLALFSIPVLTPSRELATLLPDLPKGARVWTWDGRAQDWREGLDQELPLGQGALIQVPTQTVLTFTGVPVPSSRIPVELHDGWNLIGVPSLERLSLDTQSVWAGGIESGFGDAITAKHLGAHAMTLASAGYVNVDTTEPLESTGAYWVRASGADLLTLRPTRLRDAAKEFAIWTAKQAGAAGFSYGAGQLISLISPDPNQPLLDKLDAISRQVSDVQRTQQKILDQFKQTQTQIQLSEATILAAIGDTRINDVRADVRAHFDDENSQNDSFMYFALQATSAEGRRRVTEANKVDFARQVLTTWNFAKHFNAVLEAVAPSGGGPGVLDHFADKIVLSGATGATLEDRYTAMEAYFNGLVSLQVKNMTLLTNAWNTLAQVPGSGYSAEFADKWRAMTYTQALATMATRFRDASERVMAGSLRVSTGLYDAPVSVPPEVANLIVPRVDFGVMLLANEGPGVRVRVFAGTHLNEPNLYTLVDEQGRAILRLPSADSGLWRTLSGAPNQAYDAWRVRNNPAKFDSRTAVWEFYRSNDWIMYRTVLPSLGPNTYRARMIDDWKVTDDDDTPGLYGLREFRVAVVDERNQPASDGKLFGSLVLAKRAAARTALRLYNDGASSYWDYCRPAGAARPGKEHDYFSVGGNCYGGGWAGFQRFVTFYFAGPGTSAKSQWQMAFRTQMARCNLNDDRCQGGYSLGQLELIDNGAKASKLMRFSDANESVSNEITWDKTHTYQLQLRLVHTSTSNGVATQLWRKGLVIDFNAPP